MNHIYKEDFELAFCETCRLGEGTLATDCSGEDSASKSDDIYAGKLDYRENEGWVNKLNPTNQSWLKGKIINFINGRSEYKHENEIILSFGVSKDDYNKCKSEVLKYMYRKA